MSAESDHEAFLRAELRAAADSLQTDPYGLQRITARLQRRRPAPIAVALAVWNELVPRAPAWLQDILYRFASVLRLIWDRFGPVQTPAARRSEGWLRPLAAMAVVMFIVAAGTYIGIDASTGIFPSSASSRSSGSGTHQGGHSSGPALGPSQSGGPSANGSGSPGPTTSASCEPGTSKSPASASARPSASVNASSSPTPSASASPSPSPSTAPGSPPPSAGASVAPAPSALFANNLAPQPAATPSAASSRPPC